MAIKTGAQKHTHRYHKIAGQWSCSLPRCTHMIPGNIKSGVIGRVSICWDCGNEFIIDESSAESDEPTCITCRTPNFDELLEKINSLGK